MKIALLNSVNRGHSHYKTRLHPDRLDFLLILIENKYMKFYIWSKTWLHKVNFTSNFFYWSLSATCRPIQFVQLDQQRLTNRLREWEEVPYYDICTSQEQH